jgi:nucleotide-binding universal stress UspA family protein
MFNHILVPLDGSQLSEAALAPAAFLADKLEACVTLLHVIEADAPSEVHKERHLTQPEEAEAYLCEAAKRAFSPTVQVKTHVHVAPVSDVARSIVDHATSEFQPDLIVTCTHGRGGMRDLLFGSIAQQIVSRGKTPLLLIKPGGPPFRLGKILVPLDPDSIHDESLPVAEALARNFQSELHFLSVIPTYATLEGEQAAVGTLMPGTTQALLDLKTEEARDDLQTHLDAFRRAGWKVVAEVARGDPAATIVHTAEQSGADLILLATHRKAGMDAFWARSVAPKVAQRTQTPLLLIPLAAEEPAN